MPSIKDNLITKSLICRGLLHSNLPVEAVTVEKTFLSFRPANANNTANLMQTAKVLKSATIPGVMQAFNWQHSSDYISYILLFVVEESS